MNITLAGVVLFLHITAAIVAFAMAGVVHAALPAVARAKTVAEMRPWAAVLHRLDPLFPLVALVLLGLGAWLVHLGAHTDDQFSFSDGWILTAIVTLVVIEATAGALLAPQAKRLVRMVQDHDDGPPSEEIRAVATDARIWHAGHVATFGFLGVVFLMAVKPTGAIVVVPPLVGAALGLVLSTLQLRRLRVGGPATLPRQRVSPRNSRPRTRNRASGPSADGRLLPVRPGVERRASGVPRRRDRAPSGGPPG